MYTLQLLPTKDNTFKLVESYSCNGVTVPAGYETNGADIPRVFWSYIPPNTPKYLPAIVVHDWLCDNHMYEYADSMFEEILLEIEDSSRTRIMVRSVKFYTKYLRNLQKEDSVYDATKV